MNVGSSGDDRPHEAESRREHWTTSRAASSPSPVRARASGARRLASWPGPAARSCSARVAASVSRRSRRSSPGRIAAVVDGRPVARRQPAPRSRRPSQRFGRLDSIVANAGIGHVRRHPRPDRRRAGDDARHQRRRDRLADPGGGARCSRPGVATSSSWPRSPGSAAARTRRSTRRRSSPRSAWPVRSIVSSATTASGSRRSARPGPRPRSRSGAGRTEDVPELQTYLEPEDIAFADPHGPRAAAPPADAVLDDLEHGPVQLKGRASIHYLRPRSPSSSWPGVRGRRPILSWMAGRVGPDWDCAVTPCATWLAVAHAGLDDPRSGTPADRHRRPCTATVSRSVRTADCSSRAVATDLARSPSCSRTAGRGDRRRERPGTATDPNTGLGP